MCTPKTPEVRCIYEGSGRLKALTEDGWKLKNIKGSHRQFVHATKPGKVTVNGHPSDEVAPGTLGSIMKQAALK